MQLGQGAALGTGNDRHLSPAPDRGRWMSSPGANSGSQRAELSSTPFPPPHGAVLRGCLGPAPPAGMSPALSQAIQPPGPTVGHRVPAGAQCPAQGRCQDSGQVPPSLSPCPPHGELMGSVGPMGPGHCPWSCPHRGHPLLPVPMSPCRPAPHKHSLTPVHGKYCCRANSESAPFVRVLLAAPSCSTAV